jgi:hypothetical protein
VEHRLVVHLHPSPDLVDAAAEVAVLEPLELLERVDQKINPVSPRERSAKNLSRDKPLHLVVPLFQEEMATQL